MCKRGPIKAMDVQSTPQETLSSASKVEKNTLCFPVHCWSEENQLKTWSKYWRNTWTWSTYPLRGSMNQIPANALADLDKNAASYASDQYCDPMPDSGAATVYNAHLFPFLTG